MPGRSRRLRTPGARRPALFWAAVLIAFAAGIALGGGVLARFTADGDVRDLRSTAAQLERENAALTDRARTADAFARAAAPAALGRSLTDYPVLLLVAPGAQQADVDAIGSRITEAGGQIAGTITLTEKLYADGESERLRGTVDNVAPAGVTLDAGQVDPRGRAGDLLGSVLLGKGTAPAATQGGTDALDALRQAGYLQYDGAAVPGGRAAVIVTGADLPGDQIAAGQGIGRLAAGVALHGDGTVLTGRTGSATGSGPIVVVRQDQDLSTRVATVDDVDTPVGQVTAALALIDATRGQVKAYGTGIR